jgi:hypothetical protein
MNPGNMKNITLPDRPKINFIFVAKSVNSLIKVCFKIKLRNFVRKKINVYINHVDLQNKQSFLLFFQIPRLTQRRMKVLTYSLMQKKIT